MHAQLLLLNVLFLQPGVPAVQHHRRRLLETGGNRMGVRQLSDPNASKLGEPGSTVVVAAALPCDARTTGTPMACDLSAAHLSLTAPPPAVKTLLTGGWVPSSVSSLYACPSIHDMPSRSPVCVPFTWVATNVSIVVWHQGGFHALALMYLARTVHHPQAEVSGGAAGEGRVLGIALLAPAEGSSQACIRRRRDHLRLACSLY
jgi:hypothetical protein